MTKRIFQLLVVGVGLIALTAARGAGLQAVAAGKILSLLADREGRKCRACGCTGSRSVRNRIEQKAVGADRRLRIPAGADPAPLCGRGALRRNDERAELMAAIPGDGRACRLWHGAMDVYPAGFAGTVVA